MGVLVVTPLLFPSLPPSRLVFLPPSFPSLTPYSSFSVLSCQSLGNNITNGRAFALPLHTGYDVSLIFIRDSEL